MPLSVRKLQIGLVQRRQRRGTGSAPEQLTRRTAELKWPDLKEVVQVPWCAVGAVAARLYMPERMTADLDVAILASDAHLAREDFRSGGYRYLGELSIGGSSWRSAQEDLVDVLELTDPWAEEAIKAAQANRDAQGLPVMPLPFLVIMKLDASRHQDVADLARMLGLASEAMLADVRSAVRAWRPADLEDLEALITSGRWEMEETR